MKFLILFFTSVLLNFSFSQNKVNLGSQIWMSENLNVDKFKNGDPIPEAKTKEQWTTANKMKKPIWSYYNFDLNNGKKYGKLYNWYAVNDKRGLAPQGWHIPSFEEWKTLSNFLGKNPALKMKIFQSNESWKGNNESGFSALPSGMIDDWSDFKELNDGAYWWSSTIPEYFTSGAIYSSISRNWDDFSVGKPAPFDRGFSVRCISDTPAEMNNSTTSVVNSTSNQESESKTIGKNETSNISFEEFKTKANNIADVNERFNYRVEIMKLAKNTDIKLLPRHISSYCYDLYECLGNGSFNKIESRFCEFGKTLTEISCEAILTDGLEKDVNKEVFKFNSLIYVFCSAKISTSREAYNMKIINGILNNYTDETYYNEFYKNLKDLFTDEKKANSSQYQVKVEKYVTTQLEKVKQSYSDALNNMYSNGRKFSQSEYQQDYKCKYCPDGKIIGGWKNGVDEKKKKYDPYYNYVGEEEMYTPQYLRKRFPYCSPKCAKEDNE